MMYEIVRYLKRDKTYNMIQVRELDDYEEAKEHAIWLLRKYPGYNVIVRKKDNNQTKIKSFI